jgi:FMN-dependent NADH-azoreductase
MNNLHIDSRIPGSNAITLHLSALTVERLATADPVLAQFKADGFDHQEPYLRFLSPFLDIEDATFIHAQGVSLAPDARPSVVAQAETEIERLFGEQRPAA